MLSICFSKIFQLFNSGNATLSIVWSPTQYMIHVTLHKFLNLASVSHGYKAVWRSGPLASFCSYLSVTGWVTAVVMNSVFPRCTLLKYHYLCQTSSSKCQVIPVMLSICLYIYIYIHTGIYLPENN